MSDSTRQSMNNQSYQHFLTNDGHKLYYQSHGRQTNRVLILIHGFSGSSEYFVRNFAALSQEYWVIALDLRGHGESTKATHGYHVARLAMDLSSLLDHLRAMQPEAASLVWDARLERLRYGATIKQLASKRVSLDYNPIYSY